MSWINQYTPEAKARCACEDQLARLVAIEDCLHVALVQLHEQLDAMVEENNA